MEGHETVYDDDCGQGTMLGNTRRQCRVTSEPDRRTSCQDNQATATIPSYFGGLPVASDRSTVYHGTLISSDFSDEEFRNQLYSLFHLDHQVKPGFDPRQLLTALPGWKAATASEFCLFSRAHLVSRQASKKGAFAWGPISHVVGPVDCFTLQLTP